MPANTTGQWGALQSYPYVPAHAVVLSDGKLLTFGTAQSWLPGTAGHWYHSVFDPATGQNTLLDHSDTTQTAIFCAAAIIIPGTDKVMMSGGGVPNLGYQGVGTPDINIFDPSTGHIAPAPDGEMAFPRWYPTMISLPTGQIVVLGGTQYTTTHIGMPIPEIYTPGEGWRQLTGAKENDFEGAAEPAAFYPKAFHTDSGKILYFSNGKGNDGVQEINLLDPHGNGSLTQIGTVPFETGWGQTAIMYREGKVLIMAKNGDLWTMDINGDTPTFANTGANVASQIHWSNMSVLADGSVIITGGGNQVDNPAGADRAPALWNPTTNQLTKLAPEVEDRLYHSAGILLSDGTVMSMGGTADPNKNYQIFKPPYLFDANGVEAARPVITNAPSEIRPGDTFTITVDNAAAISKLTFTKSGAVTHSANLESGFFELEFTKGANNTLTVKVPEGVNDVSAGNWMLFAWNDKGVPSKAPIVAVEPTLTHYQADGTGGIPITTVDPTLGANLIVDGGFETFTGDLTSGAYKLFKNGEVGPWQSSTNQIELWSSGHNGVNAPAGRVITEIDAQNGTLSQQVKTESGKSYDLTFDFAGRPNYVASSKAEVLWNGQVIATITPSDATFKAYSFKVTGTGGNDTLAFRSVAGDTDSVGGLLDKVVLKSTSGPVTPPTTGPELLVNGGFESSTAGFGKAGPGWTLSGAGGVDTTASRTAEGGKYFAFDGWANSHDAVLSQTINTVAGQTYTLKMSASVYGSSTSNAQMKMEALAGTSSVKSEIVAIKNGVAEYAMTFTATSAQTTIKLADVSPKGQANFDIDVDAVSVKAQTVVPPSTDGNLLVNGTFEESRITSGANWQNFDNSGVPGWQNASANLVELNKVGTTQGISLDAALDVDYLFQGVKTQAGTTYNVHFDVISLQKAGSSAFEVLWNDKVVTTIDPTKPQGFDLTVTGTGNVDKIGFRELASQNDYYGAVIDNISMKPVHEHAGSMISISAAGATGFENMALLIDGVEVAKFDALPTAAGVYTYHSDKTITADQVRVAFTNDLWEPDKGIDYNLTVDKITIDGKVFETEASTVFSTGTWTSADEIAPGYGRGDTLHANGYFQYTDSGATSHTSLLTNGSFEATEIAFADGASWKLVGATGVTGWTAEMTAEVWHDGVGEQPGTDGRNIVEIDAGTGALSQSVHTTAGETYGLSFDLAGRTGHVTSSKVEVVWNGQVITTVTPSDNAFQTYHVNLTGTGHDTLSFRSTAGDNDTVGGLLDNVILHDHAVTT